MFQPDEWQQKSLLTWYSVDNPLHLDPRHPCIKLAGEAGEILDLYGKHEYKPGFDWWKCKYCGEDKKWHSELSYNYCHPFMGQSTYQYTPLILDELGDYSYYLRILAYQKGVTFEVLCKDFSIRIWTYKDLSLLLCWLNEESAKLVTSLIEFDSKPSVQRLESLTFYFLAILDKLNTPISQVLELNYKKLNSEETNHGWKSATVKNRS